MKRTKPEDANIGARIRSRRMQLGRSQEWLGDAIGLTFQQVQKYEKGTNRVGGSRVIQIAKALGVEPSYFFADMPGAGKGDPKADAALQSFVTARDGLAIVEAWKDLTPAFRSAFVGLVQAARGA